jgi:hypothetical protein
MKRQTIYFFVILIALIFIVGGYRYYQYMVEKNFVLELNVICHPENENCFSSSDPDINFGQNPYEKVEIIAKYAPKCLEEHTCNDFSCLPSLDNGKCKITYCSEAIKVDGEECVGPNINNN